MRISDWSSDVCSSDLIREAPDVGRAPQALLWVEIAASLRLFGDYAALREKLGADLTEMKQSASFAAAPSRAASALFASLGKDVVIREQVTLERRLARLDRKSTRLNSSH